MAIRNDILQDDEGDDLIENGDFQFGESTQQHCQDIMEAMPGDYKHSPLTGLGVVRYLNAPDAGLEDQFERELRTQIEEMEGMKISNLDLNQGIKNLTFDVE